jgi:sugar phosphate permease
MHTPPTELEEKRSSKGVPRRRWLIAFLLAFGVLVNYFDRVNLSVAKQALERDFGINNVMFVYLLSAYNWTYASLQLPMRAMSHRTDLSGVIYYPCLALLVYDMTQYASPHSRYSSTAGPLDGRHWREH